MIVPVSSPSCAPGNIGLSPQNYAFLQKYVYTSSGIVLDQNKQYLLEARLLPIVEKAQLSSLNALCEVLLKRPSDPVGRLVVDAMTTNETLFFRDPILFEVIRTQVLPLLFGNACKRKVRIWSAASSTGQEAYSLAMLLLEAGYTPNDVEIVGTDISSRVLERAREGIYNKFEMERGMPPALQTRYFTPCDAGWRIKDNARKMVSFEPMDLRGDLRPLGRFDLVMCRNVLIYFDLPTKRQIIGNIVSTFNEGAVLTLGSAETLINVFDKLNRKSMGQCTFYEQAAAFRDSSGASLSS